MLSRHHPLRLKLGCNLLHFCVHTIFLRRRKSLNNKKELHSTIKYDVLFKVFARKAVSLNPGWSPVPPARLAITNQKWAKQIAKPVLVKQQPWVVEQPANSTALVRFFFSRSKGNFIFSLSLCCLHKEFNTTICSTSYYL